MAAASLPELEELIRTTGLSPVARRSHCKARGWRRDGEVRGQSGPQTMPELLRIPGVSARKTAGVVLVTRVHIADGVVVDTHVLRISRRL